MKNLYRITGLVILVAFLLNPVFAGDNDKKVNKVFSENLVVALKSDNMGLKKSAMQMIIRYGDHLNVKEAAFDIMDVYRFHPNDRVRHLAMVAIYKMDYELGIDFIIRNLRFEDYQPIKDRTYAIMLEMQKGLPAEIIAEKYALLD